MLFRIGSSGDQVVAIQTRLRELGLYQGPLDGRFGGGTESSVKTFQRNAGLGVDGEVGPNTWKTLFPGVREVAPDPILAAPASTRCLALTGSFETSTLPPDCFAGLTGDFDGQGISFGALQWNFGQGSLQPLLTRMIGSHHNVCKNIFHERLDELEDVLTKSIADQLAWTRTLQDRRNRVMEPWRGLFKSLGRTPEFQAIQTDASSSVFNRAKSMAAEYGVASQRGTALMFDIVTQNGSISAAVKAEIFRDFAALTLAPGPDRETERMRIVARRRAAVARPAFREDVLKRKLTFAEGTGVVHGVPIDLERQFGLTLAPLV